MSPPLLASGQPLPPGDPGHLGVQVQPDGLNLALWAPEAQAVWFCAYAPDGQQELGRWPLAHPRHGVWHGHLAGAGPGLVYGWRVAGRWAPAEGLRFNAQRLLLDPWATAVVGRYDGELSRHLGHDPRDPSQPHPEDNGPWAPKGRVCAPRPPAARLARPPAAGQRVVAEVHVRAVSMQHPEVPAELRGSYAALAHPALIAHWQALGITTLELLPVQAIADEARLQALGLRNHWGYSTLAYGAPEPRYWSGRPGTTPEGELREAIAALHAAGFEVVLDVVFNHTAETDEAGPTLSWRGIANRQAYRLDPQRPGGYLNWSGCGNSLNLGEPQVLRWALDMLRHWVSDYGVDGFRFDLAPSLAREHAGRFSPQSPFLCAMQADPLLRQVLCIAEPWDLGPEGYQPGAFPPGWLEWNDKARDALRAYWLRPGDARASRAELAQRLAGSSDRFRHDPARPRGPLAGVNFITAHDGFTLADLVAYDQRHNGANGEHNRDGHHDNLSWNAGTEGPSPDPGVRATRAALQRALLASLVVARGTPMLLAGDELGHSQQGNNNAYCQDNPLTWLDWTAADPELARFLGWALQVRQRLPALHADRWLDGRPGAGGLPDVSWLRPDGQALSVADWHAPDARGLMVLLREPADPMAPGTASPAPVLLLFNPDGQSQGFQPPPSGTGAPWRAWLHSHRPDGRAPPEAPPADDTAWTVPARSLQVWSTWPPD